MQKLCGIYAIVNLFNNKMIIGSSNHIYKRWKYEHLWHLKNGNHPNSHLQNSFNKYGKDFFELRILELCEESKLIEKENYYIFKYKTIDKNYGYNMQSADRSIIREETRNKISASKIGHKTSKETRKKISLGNIGKKQTEEAKRKIGLASSLRIISEETKEKHRKDKLGFKFSKNSKIKMRNSAIKAWKTRKEKVG